MDIEPGLLLLPKVHSQGRTRCLYIAAWRTDNSYLLQSVDERFLDQLLTVTVAPLHDTQPGFRVLLYVLSHVEVNGAGGLA